LTEPDSTAPHVNVVRPTDGERHAARETSIEAGFSERIDPRTVHSGSVYLAGPDGIVAVPGGPALDESGTRVQLLPSAPLAPGGTYALLVSHLVSDLAGNLLDQDPLAPGAQDFASSFRVGYPPVIVWNGGVCSAGDSARVRFDASGSYEPDADDSLRIAIWDWGVGARDTLTVPAGLIATHDYGCLDLAGCDALDNDGDGGIDETGRDGCDESHRVILRLVSVSGMMGADTAGVAFCAFQVLGAQPAAGDSVGMTDSLQVAFSHAILPLGPGEGIEFVRLGDPEPIEYGTTLKADGRVLVIYPLYGFGPGDYRVTLTEGIRDALGTRLDQDPCQPGHQVFEWTFYGPRRSPLPPLDDNARGYPRE
jgi:hypothetical protein